MSKLWKAVMSKRVPRWPAQEQREREIIDHTSPRRAPSPPPQMQAKDARP